MEGKCNMLKRNRKLFGGHKVVGGTLNGIRRGKAYGSVKLKSKSRKTTTPWSCDDMEGTENSSRRKSEIRERDNFLELLSKVQDNRYNSQRYTIKAGPTVPTSEGHMDDVFEESRERSNSVKVANGVVSNGSPGRYHTRNISDNLPTVEITDSPSSVQRRIQKAASVGSMSAMSHDSRSPDEGRPSSAGSRETGQGDETDRSLSPTHSADMALSPSRKSTEALKKAMDGEGPYPMLIGCPDGGYWLQNGIYEVAKGEDGVWRAPEISTEHYIIQTDKTATVYGRYFKKQDHQNYISRDTKRGPVILSLKLEEDYQGTLARVLIRTQKETIYKILSSAQLPAATANIEPEDYMKIASLSHGSEMNVDKAIPITSAKATDLLQKFDEHPLAKTHKFGVIYQQFGQASEEELFGNVEQPESLTEFLEMLGDKVKLQGFEGYRGGLDVTNNQTGDDSVYTEFKDRKIMFHVSTMLPHDQGDTQYVQKKRHIGNDIVVIIFQDANTPFCPNMIRSHFVHAYIIVQVEHPNTDHTVYKVAVCAKDEVPEFGPSLPDPAVFQKGTEFRDWLLMKALNAEFNCHQASSFKKLATRTRDQLFVHLVEEVAQTIEEVDGLALSKELTASLERGSAASPDVSQISRNKKRRRTLTNMFKSTSTFSHQSTPSPNLGSSSKRKSATGSPKIYKRHPLDLTSPVRQMLAGSTPDLVEEGSLEYSEQPEPKKEKGSLSRKLTFRKNQENVTKEKEKRSKPKRTASVTGPSGYSVSDYRHKRNKSSISPGLLRKREQKLRHDSSEESSIASGINLGGSVPSDLPGTVDRENVGFNHASLGSGVRPGSTLTLEDVSISMSQPEMVDASVQCSPAGSSVIHYNPSSGSPILGRAAKGEHSKRLHSVNNVLSVHTSPLRTQSLPGSPLKKRRSPEIRVGLNGGDYFGGEGGTKSPTLPFLQDQHTYSKRLYANQMLSGGNRTIQELKNRGVYNDGRMSADQVLLAEDKPFYRAESLESVSGETDEMYNSLLHSLEFVNSDAARLREHNFTLIRENVKFASQNRDLKAKFSDAKEQLAAAQQKIKDLEEKLRLCQLQPIT